MKKTPCKDLLSFKSKKEALIYLNPLINAMIAGGFSEEKAMEFAKTGLYSILPNLLPQHAMLQHGGDFTFRWETRSEFHQRFSIKWNFQSRNLDGEMLEEIVCGVFTHHIV